MDSLMRNFQNMASQFNNEQTQERGAVKSNALSIREESQKQINIIRSVTAFAVLTAIATIAAIVFSFLMPTLLLPAIIAAAAFGIITMGLSIPATQKINQGIDIARRIGA